MAWNERREDCGHEFGPEITSRLAGDGFLHYPYLCSGMVEHTGGRAEIAVGASSLLKIPILRTKQEDGLICVEIPHLKNDLPKKNLKSKHGRKAHSLHPEIWSIMMFVPILIYQITKKTLSSYCFIEPFTRVFNCQFLILSNG